MLFFFIEPDLCRSMGRRRLRLMRRRRGTRRRRTNQLNRIVSLAQINIQMVAIDIQVFIFYLFFYFPLKYDPLEQTPRKAEGYACQNVLCRLSKCDSIFKATYSHKHLIDMISMHVFGLILYIYSPITFESLANV